jgi:hypothetical protein
VTTDVDTIRRLLTMAGYECGSWFLIPQALVPFGDHIGDRRWVLRRPYHGGVAVYASPRTTSGGGHPHPMHPLGHQATCRVDEDGHVVPFRTRFEAQKLWACAYSCEEPYADLLLWLGCRPGASQI